MQNKISISIDETKLKKVRDAIKTIDENLPLLITLTPDERDILPRYGDKSTGFVEKAYEFGSQYPDILPSYFSLPEMEKDIKGRNDLLKILTPLKSILEKISDSYMLTGSESYTAALRIYDTLKKADHDGIPGLRAMIEELQKRFPGRNFNVKAKQN